MNNVEPSAGPIVLPRNSSISSMDSAVAPSSASAGSTLPPSSFSSHSHASTSTAGDRTSASSIPSTSSHLVHAKQPRTPTITNTTIADASGGGDGFLGEVARWDRDKPGSSNGIGGVGARTSRLVSNGVGNGQAYSGKWASPPPPGPPPSEPPPLPPASQHQHPYAAPLAPLPRTTFGRPAGRLSQIASSSLRKHPLPANPPPTSDLPPLPDSAAAAPSPQRQPSLGDPGTNGRPPLHARSSSMASGHSLSSPPASPSLGSAPTISPRGTSLFPNQAVPASAVADLASLPSGSASTSAGPSSVSGATTKSGRTPSRQLLQNALDLAQRAVELDRSNDVPGALVMYTDAVTKLKSVMARVGVEPGKEDPRRRAGAKSEEEGRTLRGIHDAYVARIQLLSSMEPEPTASTSALTLDAPSSSSNSTLSGPASSDGGGPSASTATLVPDYSHSPRSNISGTSGERTPRPSLDETAITGIGNLMISSDTNQSFRSVDSSPVRPRHPFAASANAASSSQGPSLLPSPAVASPRAPSLARSSQNDQPATPASVPVLGTPVDETTPRDHSRPPSGSTQPAPPLLVEPPPRKTSIGLGHPSRPASRDLMKQRKLSKSSSGLGLEDEVDLSGIDGVETLDQASNGHPVGGALFNDRPLPPLPSQSQAAPGTPSKRISSRFLVNNSTALGTISQRRQSRNASGSLGSAVEVVAVVHGDLPAAQAGPVRVAPASTTAFPGQQQTAPVILDASLLPARQRSRSQPGQRRPPTYGEPPELPPLPKITHKPSMSFASVSSRISSSFSHSNSLAPPLPVHSRSSSQASPSSLPPMPSSAVSARSGRSGASAMSGGSLLSPLPETQPSEIAHRPFHLLRLLHSSMDPEGPGAYLTGAIHISAAVWKPSGWGKGGMRAAAPKIQGQDVKVRCFESLVFHLQAVRQVGQNLLDAPRERIRGKAIGVGREPRGGTDYVRGVAEEFVRALEGLEEEMDVCHKALSKAGVVMGPWKGKKGGTSSGWGKLTRSVDKMASGSNKPLDSPDKYVDLLAAVCTSSQMINDHLLNFTSSCTPAYHTLPEKTYRALEVRLNKAAEFFGAVIVPSILDDAKHFFLRYLSSGVRYLEA